MPRSASVRLSCRLLQPGAGLLQQLTEGGRDLLGPLGVGGRSATEGVQRGGAPCQEGPEPIADGLGVVAEVLSDPGSGPAGIREADHLDAVADLGRAFGASQPLEFVPGRFVEGDADHAEL
jgi:hypothetical protein